MSSTANVSSNNDPWSISSKSNEPVATKRRGIATTKKHVPNAWDDEEGEAGEEAEEVGGIDNATVWRDANTKQPMPEVILTATSSSASTAPLPAAALQQPMRILKRPTATSAFPGSASSADVSALGQNGSSNLKDREAAYQAARARIFGIDASDREGVGANSEMAARNGGARENATLPNLPNLHTARSNVSPYSSSSSTPPTPSASILRAPRGPSSSSPALHSSTALSIGGSDGSSTSGNTTPKGFTRRGRDRKGRGETSSSTPGSGSGSSGTKS